MIRDFYGFGKNKKHKNREKRISMMGFVFLALSAALLYAARNSPSFGEWYAVTVYPALTAAVGGFFGLLPFSAVELLLYFFIVGFLFYGFTHWRRWRQILNFTFFLASFLFFLYTVNCGINYYRRPFSDFLDYKAEQYSVEELSDLLDYLTEQVNREAADLDGGKLTAGETAAESVKAMEGLGQMYPALSGFYPRPKKLLISRILSVQQLAGVYSPFTIEANYNGEMTAYNIPHTACHELSHLRGFMREDEANFIGFLACISSEDRYFNYSGYLTGWIYAGNALADEDRELYGKYWARLEESVKDDLRQNSAFWDRFDGRTAKAAETLNDTYLKANRQTEGVKSYGRAVDLLLAWYKAVK